MKILLVKIPGLTVRKDRMKDNSTEYLGINYIASLLRQNGIETEIQAYSIKSLNFEELVSFILKKKVDCIGFSILYDFALEDNIAVIKELRKRGCKAKIVVGGHPATFYYKEMLQNDCGIDFVCLGEGEFTFLELIQKLESNLDISQVKGIAYKKNGEIIFNGYREVIENLDGLPFPARDELELVLSETENFELPINISCSRGCSWSRCSFCDIQSFYGLCDGDSWRGRSVKNIVDELEEIFNKYHERYFNIVDDDFFGPANNRINRITELVLELKRRNLDLRFDFLCNVRDIDDKTLEVVRELGVESMFLGVESGVKRILKTMKKGITPEMSIESIKKIEDQGMICKCGSIFIDPYTTLDELKENIDFWKRLNRISLYSFNKMFLYKGTPIEAEMREKGRIIEKGYELEYKLNDEVDMVYNTIQRLKISEILPHTIRLKRTTFELSQKKPFGVNNILREVTRYVNFIHGSAFREFLDYCIEKIEKEKIINEEKEIEYFKQKYLKRGEKLQQDVLMELRKLGCGDKNERRFNPNMSKIQRLYSGEEYI